MKVVIQAMSSEGDVEHLDTLVYDKDFDSLKPEKDPSDPRIERWVLDGIAAMGEERQVYPLTDGMGFACSLFWLLARSSMITAAILDEEDELAIPIRFRDKWVLLSQETFDAITEKGQIGLNAKFTGDSIK